MDDKLSFPDDYLEKMEAGPMDDSFMEAIGRLSPDQREHLALILADRLGRRAPM